MGTVWELIGNYLGSMVFPGNGFPMVLQVSGSFEDAGVAEAAACHPMAGRQMGKPSKSALPQATNEDTRIIPAITMCLGAGSPQLRYRAAHNMPGRQPI